MRFVVNWQDNQLKAGETQQKQFKRLPLVQSRHQYHSLLILFKSVRKLILQIQQRSKSLTDYKSVLCMSFSKSQIIECKKVAVYILIICERKTLLMTDELQHPGFKLGLYFTFFNQGLINQPFKG